MSPTRVLHINPTIDARTAKAPYNFVPLPEAVLAVEDGLPTFKKESDGSWSATGHLVKPWEAQDRFLRGTASGWIDLEILTLTPLFIRGAVEHEKGAPESKESRLRPESYKAPDGRPAIPGSSLRGMIRNLVEILSFSKVQPVSKERQFFRTVSDDSLGDAYRRRVLPGGTPPSGGFLRRTGRGWTVERATAVLRVPRNKIEGLNSRPGPSYHPTLENASLQAAQCWVQRIAGTDLVTALGLMKPNLGAVGWEEGVLWLTGNAPKKQHEFVLLKSNAPVPATVDVPDAVWRQFCLDEQITGWQEKNFPEGWPSKGVRSAAGKPAEGDVVFFLETAGQVEALGRARMFRIAYDLSPQDLVPGDLKENGLDLAEALFGRVDDEAGNRGAQTGFAGRVRFEDAVAMKSDKSSAEGLARWLEDIIVPRNLASPKPTAFQHYLVQTEPNDSNKLRTYLARDRGKTEIRGHKLYWHRWDELAGLEQVLWREPSSMNFHGVKYAEKRRGLLDAAGIEKAVPAVAGPPDKQCTLIQPVCAGVTFAGQIRFDNLTPIELGGLLAALELPAECAHRLGMAKPLGLGSVRISTTVQVLDRDSRYRGWAGSHAAQDEDMAGVARAAFEDYILKHARDAGEPAKRQAVHLRDIARLDSLYVVLNWEERPERRATRSLRIENGEAPYRPDRNGRINEFRDRPVLPTPRSVRGLPPLVVRERTPVGNAVPASAQSSSGGSLDIDGRMGAVPLTVGGAVVGIVLPRDQWTKKGNPRVKLKGMDACGVLHLGGGKLPAPGTEVNLTVKAPSANPKQNEFELRG